MISVKGKLFEYFVCKLLLHCGFRQVKSDNVIVYQGSAGTMIHGLGQAHNADVLLEPPYQTPFYFSTRLLVECKCYNDTVGLPIIRNALGLREDINNFDIVTEEILNNRRNSHTTRNTCYPIRRYSYQVAVASFEGFKSTAIPFAQTHKIPLISFSESSLFTDIRNAILEVESRANGDTVFAEAVLGYLKEHQYSEYEDPEASEFDDSFIRFNNVIRQLQKQIVIGLLEDGTLLFMIKEEGSDPNQSDVCSDDNGYEIYWHNETRSWELVNGNQKYFFELPKEIQREWVESMDERMRAAVEIKQRYFSRIVLFDGNSDDWIRTLTLSEKFLQTAKQALDME